ncbi:hypothetical protein [Brevibacillus centrosporus]|uniref:Uncharacterized protein n=1 Tax=Brevibacillus centrosporus TaxID=54910 RepID=A0A1I3S9G8_9BACL|nr:hypothetical protein [Brevibacillus centrosporus]MEC2131865.1 hypothetical protein [Brevibacillus centrosporus]MED4909289.1 hypothetical protein [Brevibacillus centrosporus]RNB69449.1 hypothetical protein EDM55_13780 [Brevibacillus centrosporus]SFJ54642.1 hypothetical protein SAMN05518846_10466 [Brevibacillus centrosporus]GED33288.1 hypothetical protein BCE02nite_44290 [Brevibacillus centrosporus]
MSKLEATIRLEQRFALLREVIASYRIRLQEMEQEVVQLFSTNQLSAISACMGEKQRIVRLMNRLEQFIHQWENNGDVGIVHETKREPLNT